METTAKDKLMEDLRTVAADVEELLRATAGQTGERVAEARAKAEESLRMAKARIEDAGAEIVSRARAAASRTDDYVHDKPWQSIGVAAGMAFLVGYLIGRR